MRHRLFLWRGMWMCLPLLTACSSYAPPPLLSGMSRNEVVTRMGSPAMERKVDAGSRLEFPPALEVGNQAAMG